MNRKSTVQLDTKELPLNVRLDTTSFDVAVARGTVISRTVTATVMKQLLLGITLADGSPAPSGSSVLDEHDGLIGVVMGEGNVMLNNEQIGRPVKLRIANQGTALSTIRSRVSLTPTCYMKKPTQFVVKTAIIKRHVMLKAHSVMSKLEVIK